MIFNQLTKEKYDNHVRSLELSIEKYNERIVESIGELKNAYQKERDLYEEIGSKINSVNIDSETFNDFDVKDLGILKKSIDNLNYLKHARSSDQESLERILDMHNLKNKVNNILKNNLPRGLFFEIGETLFSSIKFEVFIAASEIDPNLCPIEMPQCVHFNIDVEYCDLFVCEEYIRIKSSKTKSGKDSVRIPYDDPGRGNIESVLASTEQFVKNYVKTLRENQEKLLFQDVVDHQKILK